MPEPKRDRHAKDQINVRLDPDLISRLRDGATRHDQTVTGIVTRGVTGELDRLDGIATSDGGYTPPAPVVFVAAEDEQPQQAGENCKHRNMRIGKGVCPDCKEWIVKS